MTVSPNCLTHSLLNTELNQSNRGKYNRLGGYEVHLLDVRPSRCVTVGDRSFATAGPRLWNSLYC